MQLVIILMTNKSNRSLHAVFIAGSQLGQAEALLPYQTKEWEVVSKEGEGMHFPLMYCPLEKTTWPAQMWIIWSLQTWLFQTWDQEVFSNLCNDHVLGRSCSAYEHLSFKILCWLETVMHSFFHGWGEKTGNDQEITQLRVLIAHK